MKRIVYAIGFSALLCAHQAAADATLAIETGTADPQAPQITRVYLKSDDSGSGRPPAPPPERAGDPSPTRARSGSSTSRPRPIA
jgi:hypothetical protein